MTAHADHYGKSVLIPGDRHDLEALRERLMKTLLKHRSTSTRMGESYKNPVREGYDRGLTHAIDEIDLVLRGE